MTERKPTILVIDDEATITGLVKTAVEEEGEYQVQTAANGQEGLALLQEGLNPGLIFLDMRMPIMDGRGVLEEIKKHNGLNKIPIIIISASDGHRDYSEYPQVVGKLPKPFDDINDILKTITRHIRLDPSPPLVAACT